MLLLILFNNKTRCLIKELKNGEIYFRVSKKEIKYIDKYCVELASIYMGQEKVIREFDNLEINLIKMFQDNPIPDNGFYDGIHTNTLGANYIANYLKERLKCRNLVFEICKTIFIYLNPK